MRRAAVFLAMAVLCCGLGGAPAGAQADAASVARALIEAENAHDVDAAVSLFAPNAIVNLPTGALVTRAQIEQWQRELAAGNFHADITPPVAVTPEIVTFSGTVALDSFRRLGISPLEANWELTIQLGKVTIFNFSFTPAAAARLQTALAGAGSGAATPQPGGSQAGGSQSVGSQGGGSATQATPASATTGRSLALTGTNGDLAPRALLAIALGALLVLAGRRVTADPAAPVSGGAPTRRRR